MFKVYCGVSRLVFRSVKQFHSEMNSLYPSDPDDRLFSFIKGFRWILGLHGGGYMTIKAIKRMSMVDLSIVTDA